MSATYRVDGLHCSNCVGRVQKALDDKGFSATVTLKPPQVTVAGSAPPSQAELAAVIAAAGDYKLGPAEGAPGTGLLSKLKTAFSR